MTVFFKTQKTDSKGAIDVLDQWVEEGAISIIVFDQRYRSTKDTLTLKAKEGIKKGTKIFDLILTRKNTQGKTP